MKTNFRNSQQVCKSRKLRQSLIRVQLNYILKIFYMHTPFAHVKLYIYFDVLSSSLSLFWMREWAIIMIGIHPGSHSVYKKCQVSHGENHASSIKRNMEVLFQIGLQVMRADKHLMLIPKWEYLSWIKYFSNP